MRSGPAVVLAAVIVSLSLNAQTDLRLVEAAKRRDAQAVAELLRRGVDANAAGPDGTTALHWAAHWDDVEAAKLLLRAGAQAGAATDLGVTPLALACGGSGAPIIDALLEARANPNAAASTGETPLMACARAGNEAGTRSLVAARADPNAREASRGQTALMWAAARGHAAIVKLLIDAGADVNSQSSVRSLVVSRTNRYGGVGGTNRGIVDVGQGGSTPLLFAARNGHVEAARLLVAAGADVNAAGQDRASALVLAAHSGQTDVALFLIDRGADPNDLRAGYTPLHAAILKGDLTLVRALLAKGSDPSARLGNGTAARRYSQDYAFTDAWIGMTPFWLAARFAEPAIMQAIADHGGNTSVVFRDGTTALMAAAGVGSGALLAGSLSTSDRRERRVDPVEASMLDAKGAERRVLDAVTIAARLGGSVTAANQAGDTALHGAAANGYPTVIQFLVDSGANVAARNKRGQTASAVAAPDSEAAALLRRLSPKP